MDFMSNNMYYDNTLNTQSTSAHNKNEFMVDRYSCTGNTVGATLYKIFLSFKLYQFLTLISNSRRSNSLFDTSGKESKIKSQTRLWLVNNKIIQITTGLFSNICVEEPSSLLARKNRLNKTNNSGSSTNKSKTSSAIDIPINESTASVISSTLVNDSMASSITSSTSQSVNNSFSSASLNSQVLNTNSKTGEKFADSCSLNSNCNKSELEYLDEAIDGIETESDRNLKNAIINQQNRDNETEITKARRPILTKKRYVIV